MIVECKLGANSCCAAKLLFTAPDLADITYVRLNFRKTWIKSTCFHPSSSKTAWSCTLCVISRHTNYLSGIVGLHAMSSPQQCRHFGTWAWHTGVFLLQLIQEESFPDEMTGHACFQPRRELRLPELKFVWPFTQTGLYVFQRFLTHHLCTFSETDCSTIHLNLVRFFSLSLTTKANFCIWQHHDLMSIKMIYTLTTHF